MSWVELDIEVAAVERERGAFLRVHFPLVWGQAKPYSYHCFRGLFGSLLMPLPLPPTKFLLCSLLISTFQTGNEVTVFLLRFSHVQLAVPATKPVLTCARKDGVGSV